MEETSGIIRILLFGEPERHFEAPRVLLLQRCLAVYTNSGQIDQGKVHEWIWMRIYGILSKI